MAQYYHKHSFPRLVLLSWVSVAHGVTNKSFSSNTSSIPSTRPITETYEPTDITQLEPADRAWLRSSRSIQLRTDPTEGFGTKAKNYYIQSDAASHISSQLLIDSAYTTDPFIDVSQSLQVKSYAAKSSTYQHIRSTSSSLLVTQSTTPFETANETIIPTKITPYTHSEDFNTSALISSSICHNRTYDANYPVTLRSLPSECNDGINLQDMEIDSFGNYDVLDRCLVRWCFSSSVKAAVSYTGTTGLTSRSLTWMSVSFKLVYKSTLTASDEDIAYNEWSYGSLQSTTITCMLAVALLL